MTSISPVLVQAYARLRQDIYHYLDETEYLAQFEIWDDKTALLIRKAVPDLTTVIRGVVVEHESTVTGRCKQCGTSWPCPVTESIYRLIKAPEPVFRQILDHVRRLDPDPLR